MLLVAFVFNDKQMAFVQILITGWLDVGDTEIK